MGRKRHAEGRCPRCNGLFTISSMESHNGACPHCGHQLNEGSVVRVLDGSGALLTPCTKERAQEEVRYGNAFWVNERTIRLRFSAMSKKKYRETVLRRDSGRCVWCGAPATTMDHIIPESKGGRFHPKNLMCACLACNQERKNMDIPEFLAHCEATGQTVRRKHILALYREAVRFQYHGENSNERNR